MEGKEGRVVRNMYKVPMDKTKGGKDQGWEVGMPGVGGSNKGKNGDNYTWMTIKNVKKKSAVEIEKKEILRFIVKKKEIKSKL